MQDLRLMGVEDGALVLVSDDGARYRVRVDDELKSTVRLAMPERSGERKLTPREIQVLIRGGQSAEQISTSSGVPLDYVERFEGPVLAEREFVTSSAQAVPVRTALDTDPVGSTFGEIIATRLQTMSASEESWTSWKEEGTGWVVSVTFVVEEVDHDARWQFDPKRNALSPANAEAIRLSQQGDASATTLIPRLRAVDKERPIDTSRFDSGAFLIDDVEAPASAPSVAPAQPEVEHNQTADLLEALRRRRGEREPALYGDELEFSSPPSSSDQPGHGVRLVDVPMDDYFTDAPYEQAVSPAPADVKPSRRGRATMPSWDDIVFGTKPDDDPA